MGFANAAIAAVNRFDRRVDELFEPLRRIPFANRVAYLASESAHYSMLWHGMTAVMAIARPDLRRHAVRTALVLGAESILVNGIIKPLAKRERPVNWEVETHQVRRPKTNSFPSGHASSGAVAATMFSAAMPKGRVLWWGLAAIVGASRVHTRMHHASDVVAGAALGRFVSTAALKTNRSIVSS